MSEFRACIIREKQDIKKGDLSKWIEKGIKNLIKQHNSKQQQSANNKQTLSKDEKMINDLTELMKQIKSNLWNDAQNPIDISCGNTYHEIALKQAIANVRNINYTKGDGRRVKEWFKRLMTYGFIERIGASNKYKVLNDGHQSLDVKQMEEEQKKKEVDDVMGKCGV